MPSSPTNTWRRHARASLTRAAAAAGVLSRFERRMAGGWTILTYHRILENVHDYPFEGLVTPADAFRAHVEFLRDRCRVLPVGDALETCRRGQVGGRPLVSITFDDGYVDGIAIAAPILEEADLRATYFITTGPVGTRERLWFDRAARRFRGAAPGHAAAALREALGPGSPAPEPLTLRAWMAALKSLPPHRRDAAIAALRRTPDERAGDHDRLMTPEEIADLARRGHEVAAHTVTHPVLTTLDDAALERELRVPIHQLAAWTGAAPAGLCYPNGDHDGRIAAAAARAGYRYACTTLPGRNDPAGEPLALRRIDMNPGRMRRRDGRHDPLAFRAELCLLHSAWR